MSNATVKSILFGALLVLSFILGRFSMKEPAPVEIAEIQLTTPRVEVSEAPAQAPKAGEKVLPRVSSPVTVVSREEMTSGPTIREMIAHATVLLEKGKGKQAIAKVDRAVAQDPSNSELLTDAANFHYKLGQNPKKAAELFEKAYDLKPENVDAFNGLVETLYAMEDDKLAVESVRRVAESHPERFEPNLALGDLHLQGGRYGEAIQSFENARRADPNDPQALQRIAQVFSKQNQPAQAAEALGRAEKLVDQHIRNAKENGMEAPRMEKDKLNLRLATVEMLAAAGNGREAARLFEEVEGQLDKQTVEVTREKIARGGTTRMKGVTGE